jgi:hypothetical protein
MLGFSISETKRKDGQHDHHRNHLLESFQNTSTYAQRVGAFVMFVVGLVANFLEDPKIKLSRLQRGFAFLLALGLWFACNTPSSLESADVAKDVAEYGWLVVTISNCTSPRSLLSLVGSVIGVSFAFRWVIWNRFNRFKAGSELSSLWLRAVTTESRTRLSYPPFFE